MQDYFADTALLVHAATATYVLGFLFRNQFILRGLILLGTVFYILYYYYHTGSPLWDAIIGSILIGIATVIGLGRVIYSRIPIGMNQRDRELFETLGGLEPGEFRELMKIANRVESPRTVDMTHEGKVPKSLFYVIDGSPVVEKGVTSFRIGNKVFIGEVGFFLNQPASATVKLVDGGEYVEWPGRALRRLLERKPHIQRAFYSMVTRDLAAKVSTGLQPTDLSVAKHATLAQIAERA
ncbi:MAG: cyclic nucleotide-binding domain-containing protein [Pseudomonadota bacterium]